MAHSYSFKAGAYRGTWGGAALGQAEDGITFSWNADSEPVVGDNLGSTIQDLIYKGIEVFCSGVFVEAGAAGLLAGAAAAWPWDATLGKVGTPGIMANVTSKGKPLVLTKVASSPAMFATITANISILAPRANVDQLLGNHIHRVPLRFQLLPDGLLDAEVVFVTA